MPELMFIKDFLFGLGLLLPQPASIPNIRSASSSWFLSRFTDFIPFGDSYTSETSDGLSTSTNGISWPRYVTQYTGYSPGSTTHQLTLHDYALSGSVCSNLVAPRIFRDQNVGFPSVIQSQLPQFTLHANETALSTAAFSLWIGTNDLGNRAFFSDSQWPGKTLADYTECVFQVWDALWGAGARYFVLMNVIPLDLTPLYGNDTTGGVGPNKYWPDKPTNHTALGEQMAEYVAMVNNGFQYQAPYDTKIAGRWPGASFALFDVHRLILEIYANPAMYFNGSAPANVTGFVNHCDIDGSNCVESDSPDSFLWQDELHPTEQTGRLIAREFVNVLAGNSTFASYWDAPKS